MTKTAKRTERDRINRFKREASMAEREIGKIPAPKDPERRQRTKNDFVAFCKEYGGEVSFYRDWQPVHFAVARDIEDVVIRGGKKAVAAPRGMFKSTFARWAILFATLQHPGRHKVVIYLGAVGGATGRSRKFILNQLRKNKAIKADFPEVCYPLEQYGGIKQRRLTYGGVPIEASWSNTEIVFPTVAGFETSGSVVMFLSIGSEGIRGADHTAEAFAIRPSFVVIDDPQSDMSANSISMVKGMHGIVTGTVRDLGGFDRKTKLRQKLSVLASCTCIAPEDLAMQLLDKSKSPDYRGSLYKRLPSMPTNMALWRKYKDIRTKSLNEKGDISDATEFYRANRAAMDAGAVCLDPTDFEEDMISGVQLAMDRWAENEYTFWTEQQNDPQQAKYSSGGFLSPPFVLRKQRALPRFHVPPESVFMTAHIDVGKHLLWYCVTSWAAGLKHGHLCDYGVFPSQGVPFIRKGTPVISLQEVYENGDEFDKVKAAIVDLAEIVFEQQYFVNGRELDTNRVSSLTHLVTKKPFPFLGLCGVDASDGNLETTIWQAVIASRHRNRLIPAYGSAAKARLMRYLPMKSGESRRPGVDWICNPESLRKTLAPGVDVTSLKYDANTFKTAVNASLLVPVGTDGTITIYRGGDEEHAMISEQLCSEDYTPRKVGANTYDDWRMKKPQVADNDLWDALVGTAALASFAGIEAAAAKAPSKEKKRLVLSDLQKKR